MMYAGALLSLMGDSRTTHLADAAIRRHFGDDAPTVRLEDGQVLLRQGEPNDRLYYVLSLIHI